MSSKTLQRGMLIVFEGGEGAGKTTLIAAIASALEEKGIPVLAVREPGGTQLGEEIRRLLLDPTLSLQIDRKAELLLFLAARAQNVSENIEPALKQGKIVLSDRFTASTIAYQGAARGLGIQEVRNACRLACGDVQPTLTFFLDIEPAIGLLRSRSIDKQHATSGAVDRMESEDLAFHMAVRAGFHAIASFEGEAFVSIDASQPPDVVQGIVWQKIVQALEA